MNHKITVVDQVKAAIIYMNCVLGTSSIWLITENTMKAVVVVINLAVGVFTIFWLRKKLNNADLESKERKLSIELKEKELKRNIEYDI